MFTKIRIFLAVICIGVAIYFAVSSGHAENTNPTDSMRILTNMCMKLDFTDAARIRMDDQKDEDSFKKEYYNTQKNIFKKRLSSFGSNFAVTDEQLQKIVDAHLEMDRKRDVKIELLSEDDKKARVRITISTYDKNLFIERLTAKLKASAQTMNNMEQVTAAMFDTTINMYQTYDPKETTESFEIECEKFTLSESRFGKAAWLSRMIMGTCWLPSDMGEYYKKLNAITL